MQRAHLSASIAALALASAFVAPRLDGARPPPAAPVGDALLAPRPPPQTAPVPTAAPVTPRRSPWSAPTCDDDAAVVVAHELSSSVLEGRELAPERLVGALSRARSALPDHVDFGAVGFAQRLWTPEGPAVDPRPGAWLPLGDPGPLGLPGDPGSTIGRCANVALGLSAALSQLETSSAPQRHLWVVVDGLHDCGLDGRFAYEPLDAAVERADAEGLDVSVLVLDAWSERRGPTPLHHLVRGRGRAVHVPAWELDEGYDALLSTVETACGSRSAQ